MKIGHLTSKCRQLVQRVIKIQTISTFVVTVVPVYLGMVPTLCAVQMMVDLVRQVIKIIRFRQPHRGRVKVNEQSPAVAQRACPLLQGAQHPLAGERRPDDPRRHKLVATAAVVRQVAAVATAKGAEVALVRFLSGVRAHVGFQVALVR